MARDSFMADFRKFFGRGLAILLPTILTLWILWQLIIFVYSNVGAPINRGLRLAVLEVMPYFVDDRPGPNGESPKGVPSWWTATTEQIKSYMERQRAEGSPNWPYMGETGYDSAVARARIELRRRGFREWWRSHWYLEVAGLLVAIVVIYLAGVILGNLIGRKLYHRLEKILARMPGFKQVYPHVKQLVDLVMGDRAIAFKTAVLVEYPRKGIWTVGFLTGNSLSSIADSAGHEIHSVFIPSTPMPFTGFTINCRRDEVIELPISIDTAVRFVITGGVLGDETRPSAAVRPRVAPKALTEASDGREKPGGQSESGEGEKPPDAAQPDTPRDSDAP
ncbi:MAG: DUF502 domain-containing protein [Phycisphaeraceae bacterium]|nr:DUF502 domain-containing protein [Phycisphaeraceae bacterium]